MAATIQLNARLDKDLKSSGDAALALIGLSPTQAVRALWEKAARRGKDLEEVAELLSSNTLHNTATEEPEIEDIIKQGWDFMDQAYASLGIDPSITRDYSDDELLSIALEDRLTERGLA